MDRHFQSHPHYLILKLIFQQCLLKCLSLKFCIFQLYQKHGLLNLNYTMLVLRTRDFFNYHSYNQRVLGFAFKTFYFVITTYKILNFSNFDLDHLYFTTNRQNNFEKVQNLHLSLKWWMWLDKIQKYSFCLLLQTPSNFWPSFLCLSTHCAVQDD